MNLQTLAGRFFLFPNFWYECEEYPFDSMYLVWTGKGFPVYVEGETTIRCFFTTNLGLKPASRLGLLGHFLFLFRASSVRVARFFNLRFCADNYSPNVWFPGSAHARGQEFRLHVLPIAPPHERG